MADKESPESNKVNLQLQDIIQIEAPDNDLLNNKIFIITFISPEKIKIANTETFDESSLLIDEYGNFQESSIIGISLISRGETDSFAQQNNLVPGSWIDIHFGGEVPEVVTGEITNLEDDMIEIKLYPSNDIIYIDFGFKGPPEDLNITSINIRSKPEGAITNNIPDLEVDEGVDLDLVKGIPSEDLEIFPYTEEDSSEDVKNRIKEFFLSDENISFGDDLDSITQEVRLDEDKIRFSIDNQTEDLLNDLLSTIPTRNRTSLVMKNLHLMIERYKQLRLIYSDFDEYGNALMPKIKGAEYKPLIDSLKNLNKKLYWVLPIVKNIKKLYDVEESEAVEYDDIKSLTLAEVRYQEENIINNFYNSSSRNMDDGNKYIRLLRELNPYFEKHDLPYSEEELLAIKETEKNILTIVDNLGDYYSSVSVGEKSNISRQKFLRDTYTTSLTVLEMKKTKNSQMNVSRKKVIHNSYVPIKSFMFLPEQVVRYSRINLPGSNILTRVNLNMSPFYYMDYLNNKTVVETIGIDDLSKKINYEEIDFLKNITEYTLGEGIQAVDKLDEYLNCIIPKTKELFELVKKYINGKLSLYSLIGYLEPFNIYLPDLTYMQYNIMNKFIDDKIKLYKKNYAESFKVYRGLIKSKNKSFLGKSNLFQLINQQNEGNSNLKIIVLEEGYGIKEEQFLFLSESEIFKRILDLDSGLFYLSAICFINAHLLSAVDINDELEAVNNATQKEIKNEESKNTCAKYVITKKYKALDELNEDNNKLIYFDVKLDPTRYEILDEFIEQRSKMKKKDFKLFLLEHLKENVGIKEEEAIEDVEAMLEGKRAVKEGYYAVLEEEDSPCKYYIRKDGKWELDDSIPSISVENNDIFCNIQPKCFKIKQDCADTNLSESILKHKSLDQILNEFDIKYEVSKEQLIELINNRLKYFEDYIQKIKKINHFQKFKYNDINYNAGLHFMDEEKIQSSPYSDLYQLIIGQSDFVKKQIDIFLFCNKFTRVALPKENQWYRYCIDTSLPLVPKFQFDLSETWNSSTNITEYLLVLERIKKTQGKLSDDGDSWVDENTGRKICDISYDNEEGFDTDGRKITSRELLMAELSSASILSESKKIEEEEDLNPNTKICLIVLNAMSKFMGISIDSEKQFILANVNLTNSRALGTKEEYEKKAELLKKKRNKTLPSWENINNQSLIILTLTYMLVAIQCSVPSIKTRKTFPGCVRSFHGYPLEGGADFSAIEYLSCVASKISSSTAPWNAIKKLGIKSISKQIKLNIEKFVVTNDEMQTKFKNKMEWLLLNTNDEIPVELDISNWQQFKPPLKPIEIGVIENISDSFKENFLRNLKTANIKQREQIDVINGKIQSFSISFLKKIQDIIKSKKPLLLNSAEEPFIENVCCQENVYANSLKYFFDIDNSLKSVNDIVHVLTDIMWDVSMIPKAVLILSLENTTLVYPKLSDIYSEETIYLAFINFCNFNNAIPIPNNLQPICKSKPDEFDKYDSVEEQIRKLKRDGITFSEEGMYDLLKINNKNNEVFINFELEEVTQIQKLRDLLDSFMDSDESQIPDILTQKLYTLLDSFSVSIEKDTEPLKSLTDYLSTSNTLMREEIFAFVRENGKLKPRDRNKIQEFIQNFQNFNLYREDLELGYFSITEDESFSRAQDFIKNMIHELVKVFPNIIINKVYSNRDFKIPSYWKLSKNHQLKLKKQLDKYYKVFLKFEGDEAMNQLLENVQIKVSNLYLLSNELFAYNSIIKSGTIVYSIFNKNSVSKLLEYCFLSILKEHINLVDSIAIKKIKKPNDIEDVMTSLEVQNELTGELVDELEIVSGERLDLNNKLSEYLSSMLFIFINTKNTINFSYQGMKDLINRAKEKEKDEITQKLKDLTDEEREIDTELKKHKLGDWGLGLQKGLTQYDPGFYDREFLENEKKAKLDQKIDSLGLTDIGEREIAMIDLENSGLDISEMESEINDLSLIAEDEGQNYEGDGDEYY